jgi:protein-arginine kinase activator protein McsA
MLFDIEEEEDIEDNALYKVMIGVSYEDYKAVDEGFPTNVLNEFLNLALADENFELATEIRDILKTKEESGEEA